MKILTILENWHPSTPRPQGKWYVDGTDYQRLVLDKLEEYEESLDLLPVSDNIHQTAQSSFYDYEVVPKIRAIPISELGTLSGYDNEMQYIKNLSLKIKKNGISPVIVGLHMNGDLWVVEGQHRTRALKLLKEKYVPAIVIVDLDISDDEYRKYSIKPKKEKSRYKPNNPNQLKLPID